MDESILQIGALTVTRFSVAACLAAAFGCGVLVYLAKAKRVGENTVLILMPLTLLLGVFCGHALYAIQRVLIYPLDYEAPLPYILNPGVGGFMFPGVLGGAALACLITARLTGQRFRALMGILFPALLLTLAVIRFAEPLSLLGKGPEAAWGFFPLSYAPEAEYPDDRYVPEFFYAGLYTLLLSLWAIADQRKKQPRHSTLFYLVLYLSGQMFFEIFRQDDYVNVTSLITFIRLNQLIAAILLGICLVYAAIRCGKKRVSGGLIAVRCAVFALSVAACVGLQFLFDKPLPLFGQTVWFADWLVYLLLGLSAVGMGWSVLSLVKRMEKP